MFSSYVICTTPRSGSTLLCKLLASTNTAGNPNSYYHRTKFMRAWAAEWNLPAPGMVPEEDFDTAYLSAAIAAGKSGTAIFGMRLMKEYLDLLSGTLDRIFPGLPSDAERFERAFGKTLYVHLTRADKVAQAVSLMKAEQSGLWHLAPDGTELERVAAPRDPYYDFERIRREVSLLEQHDDAWKLWFQCQGIVPLRVQYEALAADPAVALLKLCKALGADAPQAAVVKPGVAKLADELSLEWVRRYTAELTSPE